MTDVKDFAERIADLLEDRTADWYALQERYERDPNGAALSLTDCVLLGDEMRRIATLIREEAAKLED